MKASIVIPGRHVSSTILDCLSSIRRQNLSYIQNIIVVENGSQEFKPGSLGSDIELIHLAEGNRSTARNKGAERSSAEILIFLDADVVLEDGWIEAVISKFNENTDVVVTPIVPSASNYNILLRYRVFRGLKKTKGTFISLMKNSPEELVINSAAFAIRRNVFNQLNGFDPLLFRHEDLDFSQRLIRCPVKVKVLKTPVCKVYFEGGLVKYCLREMDQGLEKVRYFEKWDQQSWRGSLIVVRHFFGWTKSLPNIFARNPMERMRVVISFFALVGNVAGVVRKIFKAYPGAKMEPSVVRAEIERI